MVDIKSARLAGLAIFFETSNFDLKYFCSLLTYKIIKYLIWKIRFISVWSQKPKAVMWLLTCVILAKSTPISYHTEKSGCIFFAVAVEMTFLKILPVTWSNEVFRLSLTNVLSCFGWHSFLSKLYFSFFCEFSLDFVRVLFEASCGKSVLKIENKSSN